MPNPDIKLKGWSGNEFEYKNVPKIWLAAPDQEIEEGAEEQDPVLIPYTYGEAKSMTVAPDFSGGDMAVPIPEGELVNDLTIEKPEELVPENIAEGIYIAGVGPGTHKGGSGGGGDSVLPANIVYASGTYIPADTGEVVVEHRLRIHPDIITVQGKATTPTAIVSMTGISGGLANKMGATHHQSVNWLLPSGSLLSQLIAPIEDDDTNSVGHINSATPKSFAVGGNMLMHSVDTEYYWQAIGGLTEHGAYFYIYLELDGNGNLIVYGGVPEIKQFDIYVDGVHAKTVEYTHREQFVVNISDVAGEFKKYTISVEPIGEGLSELYPDQYFDSVTGVTIPSVSGTCGDGLTWILRNDGTLTISGEGAMDDYASTSAEPWASYASIVARVVVENGVTHIGTRAFQYLTNLTSISLPDSVTSIGQNMAYGCSSLVSVNIPDGVVNIEANTFYKCTALTSITIPDSVTSIGSYAFYTCTALRSITIGDKVTTIDLYAFHSCTSLAYVSLGNSVETINYRAFQGCTALTNITIPATVTTIGDNVFLNCTSLTSVIFKDTATWKRYSSNTATTGTTISSSYLANATTAATYLRATYANYWWRKT